MTRIGSIRPVSRQNVRPVIRAINSCRLVPVQRICIGAAFALIEATVMLATLVRAARFESATVQEPIPVSRVVLLPKDGMPLKVTMRSGVEH